jgi:hypothetical protein
MAAAAAALTKAVVATATEGATYNNQL